MHELTLSIAPAFGGGLFGSSTPTPAPGGMFAAPAPAHVGLFGSQPPSSQQQQAHPYGGYGSQQPQQANPHQAAIYAHQSASQRQEAARIEEAIYNLHSRYSPNAADPMNPALTSNHIPSSLCAFAAILYDPLPPEHRGGGGGQLSVPRPVHVSEKTWTEALARNPDPGELTPVPLVGATSLHTRIVNQQERADALSKHASKLRETLIYLEKSSKSSKDAISHANAEQEALRRRLLEIMRKVEIVRCMNQPTQRAEVEAQQRLGEIMNQVSSSAWLFPSFWGARASSVAEWNRNAQLCTG